MTTGSPPASSVSGPGVAETNAICFESGDQAMARPSKVSGLFVPCVSASTRGAPAPSAATTMRASLSPLAPAYAIQRPSGDQEGSDPLASAPPTCAGAPSGSAMTHSCARGRPGPSLVCTV